MSKQKEKEPPSKKEARERDAWKQNDEKYKEYWLSLSPKDRERVPQP